MLVSRRFSATLDKADKSPIGNQLKTNINVSIFHCYPSPLHEKAEKRILSPVAVISRSLRARMSIQMVSRSAFLSVKELKEYAWQCCQNVYFRKCSI